MSSQRRTKRKEYERVKKVFMIYGIPSKEIPCKLFEFQKKRGRKSQKAYLKK